MSKPLLESNKRFFQFLTDELKLGKKHLALLMGQDLEPWLIPLSEHLHTLCIPMTEQQQLSIRNIHNMIEVGISENGKINLEDDTLDTALLFNNIDWDKKQLLQELRRVLRLNSYVVFCHSTWIEQYSPFTAAFVQWLSQFKQDSILPKAPELTDLQRFFPNQYSTQHLQEHWQVNWEELWEWYSQFPQAIQPEDKQYQKAKKSLHLLFNQYQSKGKVELRLMLWIHYGLFNKYIPAISLRKSIFFHALRPFAFIFYVLVKLNIYFWQLIYKIRFRE